MRNPYLSAASNGELFERSDIINQQVHQPEFITESNEDVQARRVESNTVSLFLKFLVQLESTKQKTQNK